MTLGQTALEIHSRKHEGKLKKIIEAVYNSAEIVKILRFYRLKANYKQLLQKQFYDCTNFLLLQIPVHHQLTISHYAKAQLLI
jgi:predicted metal-dependent hydrolase